MTVPALFQNGRRIQLGRRIGKGGEGEVYAIDGKKNVALKFYTSPDPGDRAGKVMAMVRSGLAEKSKLVSFPSAVVEDGKGRLVGFLMRLVHGHQPIHHLYGPADRKANFPGVTYAFLVHAALNVARAVAEVHLRNCVIGDINHSGILVSTEAMVALIDADSFQITDGAREFLCAVGVPEYTPPELQGRSLAGIRRSANHDAFGLAVIVFQLLCMGRHPFAGAYEHGEMPLEKAIEEHRFAYSTKRAVGMRPPPRHGRSQRLPSSTACSVRGRLRSGSAAADRSTLGRSPGDARERSAFLPLRPSAPLLVRRVGMSVVPDRASGRRRPLPVTRIHHVVRRRLVGRRFRSASHMEGDRGRPAAFADTPRSEVARRGSPSIEGSAGRG